MCPFWWWLQIWVDVFLLQQQLGPAIGLEKSPLNCGNQCGWDWAEGRSVKELYEFRNFVVLVCIVADRAVHSMFESGFSLM
jgi:hypothetical protein